MNSIDSMITNQDRKRAKATHILLAVLFVIFAILTTLFGVMIPHTKIAKTLGDGEEIKAQIEGKDGTDYGLLTDYAFYRFDMYTGELRSTFSLSEITDMLQKKGESDRLIEGSLSKWSAKYTGAAGQDYYLMYDVNGNIFKLLDDGINLTLTEDYYIAEKKLEIKGMDNLDSDLYVLMLQSDNSYHVHKLDVNNIKGGSTQDKLLWDLSLSDTMDGYTTLAPMSASMGILGFSVTEDWMYVFRKGGSVIKLGLDMVDSVIDGQGINFYTLADEYYTKHYQAAYDEAYRQYFVDLMLELEQDTYTVEQIEGATTEELIEFYDVFKSETTVETAKTEAGDFAKVKAEENFVKNNPWCGSYNKSTKNLSVANAYLDGSSYAVVYPGECTIHGIIYSKKNQAVYYSNAADGYLYCVKEADLEKAIADIEFGKVFWNNIATRITSVDIGKKKFSSFGNGISFNEFANTLYLKFENERTLAIVDLNDMENYQIIYEFEGDFDVYAIGGDKDNTVTHALRQASTVDMKGNTKTSLYACTYEPNMFEQKSLLKFLFVLFLALSVVSVLLSLWFLRGSRNDRAMLKIKTIQRDLVKNRRIYIMLLFFIVVLIMFCYYEAIGAISMSFFNYTREKPAWIWNNFANYIRIFNQPDFWLSVKNMLFFLFFDLLLCIVPPLIFAYLLTMIRNKYISNWVRSLMFIPGIIPSMATMLIWREGIYGTDGVFNQIIAFFGAKEPIEWLMNTNYARWALIFMGFPYVGGYLIFYGGMMNIPSEYHEAGRLEGLGSFKSFILIDIPLIMPQIKYIFIMTFIDSAQNYARTYILGSSEMRTPVHNMYDIMMGTQADYGMASAYATIIFVFLFAAVATNFKMQKKDTMGEDL